MHITVEPSEQHAVLHLRGEFDTEKLKKRVDHDLYYIDNWSLTTTGVPEPTASLLGLALWFRRRR